MTVNTPAGRTVRELRSDATKCGWCGTRDKTLFDYSDDLEGAPAFCNRDHWLAYELCGHIREELQKGQRRQVVKATHTRVAPAPRRKPRPRKGATKPQMRTAPAKRSGSSTSRSRAPLELVS